MLLSKSSTFRGGLAMMRPKAVMLIGDSITYGAAVGYPSGPWAYPGGNNYWEPSVYRGKLSGFPTPAG